MPRPVVLVSLVVMACVEPLGDTSPQVDGPRILAVAASPPEVAPGDSVTLEALAVDADGPRPDLAVRWAGCLARKPLAELGPVAPACLSGEEGAVLTLEDGVSTTMTVPTDVCARFGPNPPLPTEGAVAGRPVDPDTTGGYHQPVVAAHPDTQALTLGAVRARCGLANVPQETFVYWNQNYQNNVAPTIAAWTLDGEPFEDDATVSAAQVARIGITWPVCPVSTRCGDGVCGSDEDRATCADDCTVVAGCAGAETYVRYDDAARTFETQVEALSATWFATGGAFEVARNGVKDAESDRVENAWTAPDAPGTLWLWAVLRDERGGVSFDARRLVVAP